MERKGLSYTTIRWAIMVLLVVTVMLIAKLAFATTTINQVGNSTWINDGQGNTTVCNTVGNSVWCN
jgi:predicted anti-sigma-YlaC factor YlaD